MPPKEPKEPKIKKEKKIKLKKGESNNETSLSTNETIFNMSTLNNSIDDGGRIATGILVSEPRARDIKISQFSLSLHGIPLVEDTNIELNHGSRYGLVGRNGCGKSTFMKVIAARSFPIPDGIDIFYLSEEIEATTMTAKEAVMSVDKERLKLEKEAESLNELLTDEGDENQDEIMDRLHQVYERLDELDASTAETRASLILSGLGFTPERQNMATKDFSGGWRMRIALARALFIQPTLLLLDEPTNHLDMEAVVWLEDYLSRWKKILFFVSHSQDFMNNVCTHIIHLTRKRLTTYSGNYDTFVQTKAELEEEQMKRYKWEQDEIKKMKDYVAKFGHGTAKNAKQAQSKEKTLEKMVRSGLTEKVEVEKAMDFQFPSPGQLSPPVLQCTDIAFGYPGCPILYHGVDFGVDLDSRVALVGPNGAGKSTLLKIMTGELQPVHGSVRPHAHLRIAKFTQHFIDVLDLTLSPLDYFLQLWPDMTREEGRRYLGRFGISGTVQTQVMGQLSDGQKSRVVLAKMAKETPHILLLDEPTNHLDMESIDSLAKAINKFEGGMVLVSHDMRLISQVAQEIWVVDNNTVMKYVGEIADFKMQIRAQMQKSNIMQGSDAITNAKAPVLVPLAPKSGITTVTGIAPIAPVAPISVAPPAPPTIEDEVMKARMERAELAIQKQRERQAKEKAEKEKAEQNKLETKAASTNNDNNNNNKNSDDDGGKISSNEVTSSSENTESKTDEKAVRKTQKQKEREEREARLKQEEEEREKRKLEKLELMEAARKLKEEEDKAREERAKLRAEKELKKKEEEEKLLREENEAKEQRKLERERKKREKELEKKQQELERKLQWINEAKQDPWTQEEQDKLEDALLSSPMVLSSNGSLAQKEKEEKWNYISNKVESKNRNQCLTRYKLLLLLAADEADTKN